MKSPSETHPRPYPLLILAFGAVVVVISLLPRHLTPISTSIPDAAPACSTEPLLDWDVLTHLNRGQTEVYVGEVADAARACQAKLREEAQ